jgi:hypothetical protein
MKLIVAGGRDYILTDSDKEFLNDFHNDNNIELLIHGGCSGVDNCAGDWAKSKNIPVKIFPADWKKHGKAAGPLRNREMAKHADAVILFPGGRGTASMKSEAEKAVIQVILPRASNKDYDFI